MLGRLSVLLDGRPIALPSSRKVRALLCFLAFAPRAVSRSQLCDLLWDTPDDPRGELRWCLSRLRSVIDTQERRRVVTSDDSVALDLANVRVDALEVLTAIDEGLAAQSNERLAELRALLGGELAAGLDVDSSPAFAGWLVAQRRRLRGCEVAILERSAAVAPDAEALAVIEKWLELAPFDRQAHERLLTLLARAGRLREAETHLQATERAFEAEGLDARPLVTAWRAARKVPTPAVTVEDTQTPVALAQPASARRASIAVMPFIDATGAAAARGGAADALAHDVITRLAKLRSLFVIAQGSVFALHERRIGPEEAGRMLDVDYVVSGTLRREESRLIISTELTETRSARIVWAERFAQGPADTLQVLDEIGNRIVAAIASEIEAIERNRAILKPPNSLDAWEAHHRGLWHMYLFNRADNERAREFFSTAVRLDPTFARAYAGLSFTHFQTVFQGWAPRQPEIELAYETAGRALMVDDRDPAAHWAMGRALWLRGEHAPAIVELEQSIDLSPNFAQGHYALAFVQSQAGDPEAAIAASDHSRHLSPFDPLLFGMLGARAMALVRLGRFEEAAAWSVKAAARPNAHQHILAIAALSHSLAGALDEARTYAVRIRKMSPGYGIADFLGAFHYDEAAVVAFREGARRIGWR